MCSCCSLGYGPLKYWEKMKSTWFLIPNIVVGGLFQINFLAVLEWLENILILATSDIGSGL